MKAASKSFLKALEESRSSWKKIKEPCDLCHRKAIWEHPAGGKRCGQCPRPEVPVPPKPVCPESAQYSGWCHTCRTKHNEG